MYGTGKIQASGIDERKLANLKAGGSKRALNIREAGGEGDREGRAMPGTCTW